MPKKKLFNLNNSCRKLKNKLFSQKAKESKSKKSNSNKFSMKKSAK